MTFKIAMSDSLRGVLQCSSEIVDVGAIKEWTNISALVVSKEDSAFIETVQKTKFGIPVFLATRENTEFFNDERINKEVSIIDLNLTTDYKLYSREIEYAASKYVESNRPPFFGELSKYVEHGNLQFDCPGHQGGAYFRKHPAGRAFYDFLGENIFRADICNADVALGDLLIHEGAAMEAEKHAAKVYNADKTYFVMNGTTTSNNIAISAAVLPGDLVLFDRNNHKSNYTAALVKGGGIPVYLETSRDSYGFIGGIYSSAFDEENIRQQIAKIDPERAKEKRPFRLAIIQLGTYDGTIYNAKQVVERIGHLCDYILFDSAWVGYEQFIPMMRNSSPLLLDLEPEDPGILVTQSVHKQQAGFSQASQIHKKDGHIKGQKRYIDHKHFNNAYMQYATTSPFYPLFASLDVNARMQEGEAGKKLWHDLLITSVNARKDLLKQAHMIRPFVPPMVYGEKWEDADTEEIVNDINFWRFEKEAAWHGFEGYEDNQYFVDPNKYLLTTPGINPTTGEYENFGVPANILASYLRENGIIPEKNDLNSILFLMTPAETDAKMASLTAQILKFESLIEEDALLEEVLPSIYAAHTERYANYTIRQLCQEIHDFYKENNTKRNQKELFLKANFPEQKMAPSEAGENFFRNNCKLTALDEIEGEIALEGALPYPPGLFCVVPGERWEKTAITYFKILEESINRFPGFAPEIQGVYFEKNEEGKVRAYAYVYDEKSK